ncbi:MAG TPA: thiamine pyrophosphate-dependent enzyme [Acetobacteraceae bacterium]|nr:thiamine pyrophosphate-dependent enzyme [Acetobacteraceae bacterium]
MEAKGTAAVAPRFVLDRREAVPALIGRHEDFLIVAGLAGAAKDIAALTEDGSHTYVMAGAMGGATMLGLGLALAQPERKVLVATGDGELLMNVGALATIAILNPPNLSILCIDNGHYGETGNQKSHTSLGVQLDRMAAGAGIPVIHVVESEADIEAGARALREHNATAFVLLRVNDGPAAALRRIMSPATCRERFRAGLLGRGRPGKAMETGSARSG